MGKMKNPDLSGRAKEAIMAQVHAAVAAGDEEAFVEAFKEYTELLQEAVMAEARGLVQAADNQVLAGRGVRALTSEEAEYYQRVIAAMDSPNPKQALSGFKSVLPETILDAIFEDLTEEHPLLSLIDFKSASALIKYLYSTMDGRHLAFWGALCDDIVKQLNAEFKLLSLEQTKLSAFVPVCKAMLALGPAWLDRYVRTILYEAIANGLEDGIINGRGIAEAGANAETHPAIWEPIGMIRDTTGAVTAGAGLPAKTPEPIPDFEPGTYFPLVKRLVTSPNGLTRRVSEVVMIVNPTDYLSIVAPATCYRRPDGSFITDVFPFPTRVVQSAYMPTGKAILGLPKRYLMVMGTGKSGEIEYSDHYRFLEDERVYLIRFYGTGRPLDNTSFIYLDISGAKPVAPAVRVVSRPDTGLEALTFDGTAISGFTSNVHYYEVSTTKDAAKVVATAASSNATVAAKLDGVAANLANNLSFATNGKYVLVITVTNGEYEDRYVLVVTRTGAE